MKVKRKLAMMKSEAKKMNGLKPGLFPKLSPQFQK